MKLRGISWLAAAALLLGACGKKETAKAPQEPATIAEKPAVSPVAVVPPVIAQPALSPEERAAKLGFVGHLPQDTGVVISIYQANRTVNALRASKLWGLAELPEGSAIADKPTTGPAALFNSEFTIALGKTVGEQTGRLLTLNRRLGYFQMRSLVNFLAEAVRTENTSALGGSMQRYNMELVTELLADPESGIGLLEQLEMPPLYLAFRTTPDLPGCTNIETDRFLLRR